MFNERACLTSVGIHVYTIENVSFHFYKDLLTGRERVMLSLGNATHFSIEPDAMVQLTQKLLQERSANEQSIAGREEL